MKVDYVIRRERRRSLSIRVTDEGKVEVRAPEFVGKGDIERYLVEKRNWILKKIEHYRKCGEEAERLGSVSRKDVRKRAGDVIPGRVSRYAELIGVSFGKIRFGFQKSRWGSCSAEGNLNFNCLLVLMPAEVLDSVIVHELCHRKFMNHSPEFYSLVLKYFPDYWKCDKWLKENGKTFFLRLKQ